MSEEKTIEELLKEKESLAKYIEDAVYVFLRNNPNVLDIEIIKNTFSFETKCETVIDISIGIKLIM